MLDSGGFALLNNPPNEYILEVAGAEYDSKAIAAVAFGYQLGWRR
jgi:hypothetical protein